MVHVLTVVDFQLVFYFSSSSSSTEEGEVSLFIFFFFALVRCLRLVVANWHLLTATVYTELSGLGIILVVAIVSRGNSCPATDAQK